MAIPGIGLLQRTQAARHQARYDLFRLPDRFAQITELPANTAKVAPSRSPAQPLAGVQGSEAATAARPPPPSRSASTPPATSPPPSPGRPRTRPRHGRRSRAVALACAALAIDTTSIVWLAPRSSPRHRDRLRRNGRTRRRRRACSRTPPRGSAFGLFAAVVVPAGAAGGRDVALRQALRRKARGRRRCRRSSHRL